MVKHHDSSISFKYPTIVEARITLVVIIVTFNRLKCLKTTLAIYQEEQIDWILVVDNASTDGTHTWLQEELGRCSSLEVIHLERNVGGAGGFEAGLRWVDTQLHGRGWVVLHDDDAYPKLGNSAVFRQRVASGSYKGFGAVAAAVVTPAGKPADINRPILNIFKNPLRTWRLVYGQVGSLRDFYHVGYRDIVLGVSQYPVDAASFVGLYLDLESLPTKEELRYPDGNLFIYGDDTLYTHRLVRHGTKLLFDAHLVYIHDTDTGYEEGIIKPAWKHYYISRNSLAVYRMISAWAGPLLYLLAMCLRLKAIVGMRDKILRNKSARGYWLGCADALRGRRVRKHEEVVEYCNG
jgi:rhamnopyranosyl-N-acetylglucosaminyl-diphospho-decaprenol beta-1,3/1,4-galactofuranosyltransferase